MIPAFAFINSLLLRKYGEELYVKSVKYVSIRMQKSSSCTNLVLWLIFQRSYYKYEDISCKDRHANLCRLCLMFRREQK